MAARIVKWLGWCIVLWPDQDTTVKTFRPAGRRPSFLYYHHTSADGIRHFAPPLTDQIDVWLALIILWSSASGTPGQPAVNEQLGLISWFLSSSGISENLFGMEEMAGRFASLGIVWGFIWEIIQYQCLGASNGRSGIQHGFVLVRWTLPGWLVVRCQQGSYGWALQPTTRQIGWADDRYFCMLICVWKVQIMCLLSWLFHSPPSHSLHDAILCSPIVEIFSVSFIHAFFKPFWGDFLRSSSKESSIYISLYFSSSLLNETKTFNSGFMTVRSEIREKSCIYCTEHGFPQMCWLRHIPLDPLTAILAWSGTADRSCWESVLAENKWCDSIRLECSSRRLHLETCCCRCWCCDECRVRTHTGFSAEKDPHAIWGWLSILHVDLFAQSIIQEARYLYASINHRYHVHWDAKSPVPDGGLRPRMAN
jgi:hypothetical protein